MKTTKFKPSEVGPIPVEWEVKRLGEIGEPLMCKRILKSQTSDSGEVPFYKIGTFGKLADAYITRELFSSFKRQYSYPQKGDILISAAGTIGRTVEFDGNDAYFQDSNIVWIGHDESVVYNKYLKWCYTGIKWQTEDGGIVTRLYNNNLRNSLIPVPPRPEQEKIAEALSDVDALLAAITKLIEKKRAIKQGAMQELLGMRNDEFGMRNEPIRRLAGFSGAWVEKRFDECFELIGNNTYSREFMLPNASGIANIHYGDILVKYGSVLDFQKEQVDSLISSLLAKSEILKDGDLIIADTAEDETVGKAVEVQHLGMRQAVAGLHTIACRPTMKFAPGWLGYYIDSSAFHNQLLPLITGTKVSSISKAGLWSTVLNIPTLAEQKAIAAVLTDMDAEIMALEAKLSKYESIKQGMMQELLTGKTSLSV